MASPRARSQHRASWPSREAANGGSSRSHGSKTYGQRGWNRQPAGGSVRSGGAPGMNCGGSSAASRGMLPRSSCVYGWLGCVRASSALPTSTIWPAYTTAMRSQMSLASAMSCVMKMKEMPRSRLRSLSRFIICAWMLTSSADVGSSSTTRAGSSTSDMAIMTRCFMPPLSSWG